MLDLCARDEVDAHAVLTTSRHLRSQPDADVPRRQFRRAEQDVDTLIKSDNHVKLDVGAGDEIQGVIAFIQKQAKSGISQIRIDVSSTKKEYFKAQCLLELDNCHSCWYSGDAPDQWVVFDFSPRLLKPDHYTLRTSGGDKGAGHLRSWRLTASNDKRTWIELDERKDVVELNGGYQKATFSCIAPAYFRMFKITQIDLNYHKDHSFILSCCEFYGQLVPRDLPQ
jgi:hypothetical protein